MIFTPMPLPEKVLQTSSCTILFYEFVIQTVFGMGMGMNVTAQVWKKRRGRGRRVEEERENERRGEGEDRERGEKRKGRRGTGENREERERGLGMGTQLSRKDGVKGVFFHRHRYLLYEEFTRLASD